jgi:hypothetical protein
VAPASEASEASEASDDREADLCQCGTCKRNRGEVSSEPSYEPSTYECDECGCEITSAGLCEDCTYRSDGYDAGGAVSDTAAAVLGSVGRKQRELQGNGRGSVVLRQTAGNASGWELKWDADPQSFRDRTFTSKAAAESARAAIEEYSAVGTFLGAGRHRASWLVGGLVVKVALSQDGVTANSDEVRVSEEAPVPVPQTVTLGAAVILAEYAERITAKEAKALLNSDSNPFDGFWVDSDCFGPQLGKLENGTIVCFDFSAQ